jgi:NADH-quinone oxidoreductase subunit G
VVAKAQRGIFEFLLANHPLDCPICDRGGECPLQDQTFAYGPGTSRYIEPKRHHVKPLVLGPTVALDRERCVLCWRCVRFTAEIAEDKSIVLLDRGDHTVVGTFQDEPYISNFSGNVVELCPVGALTSRKQRFNFRPWELQNRPSICPHCAFGCNINVSVRKNDEVIRFLSRDNPDVDDSWLCDHGRFNYEFINSPDRITAPMLRRGDAFVQVSWDEAFRFIAERLAAIVADSGPDAVVGVASPRLTNEDLFVFKRFMNGVVGSMQVDHFPRPQLALTSAGEEALGRLDALNSAISSLDTAKTIVLLGSDPSLREPVMELRIRLAVNRHGARLVVINSDEIPLSGKAHARLSYEPGRLADIANTLSAALAGSEVSGEVADVVSTYLSEGPVAIVYDDRLEGITDKNGALVAIAGLVEALGARVSVGVLPLLDAANSMGARDLGVLPAGGWGASAVDRLLGPDSQVRGALLLGANLARDIAAPETNRRLEQLDLLVVSELFVTETARLADVVLPAASFAEKLGTFTNSERRVQMVRDVVPTPGIARADWEILVDLSQYTPHPLDYALPQDVWEGIRRDVPAYSSVSYGDISPQGVRPASLQRA